MSPVGTNTKATFSQEDTGTAHQVGIEADRATSTVVKEQYQLQAVRRVRLSAKAYHTGVTSLE